MNRLLKYCGVAIIGFFLILLTYNSWPEKSLPKDKEIDKLVVIKSKRQLLVYCKNELLKTYNISLGFDPIGHKKVEGDGKTPEGSYFINDKNPNSGYYLNLGISYPNQADIEKANMLGQSPGGDIKIHGLRNGLGLIGKFHRYFDWTHGCIALTNQEIKELYDNVPFGIEIQIEK